MPTLALHRRTIVVLLALLAFALVQTGIAQAERLERLAPRETVLALGLTPGPLPDGTLPEALAELDLDAARDAWNRLSESAMDIDLPSFGPMAMPLDMLDDMAGGMGGPGGAAEELTAACPGIEDDVHALMADGWADDLLLAVTMDPFAPFPGLLATARVSDDAAPAAAALRERVLGCWGGEVVGTQDDVELVLIGDGSDLPLVVAQVDDLYFAGTRPDVVRGAVRRAAGADEPSLADVASVAAMDAQAGADGTGLRLTVRPDLVADVVEARVPVPDDRGGADALRRGAAVLRTFGSFSARIVLDDAGIATSSVLAVRRDGGDPGLADLLACDGCRASGPFLASDDAVGVAGSSLRLRAWVDWLDELVGDLSGAMGESTTLRAILREEADLDLDAALLDWLGDEVHTVRLGALSPDLRDLVVQPPSLVAMPVASGEQAEAGLRTLADGALALADRLAAVDDEFPDAETVRGLLAVDARTVDGVPYHRIRIGPTNDYALGVIGSRLVLAGPASIFATAVELQQGGRDSGFSSPGWRAVQALADDGRASWAYGDGGADLQGVADLLQLAAQPAAFGAAAALEAADQREADLMGGDPWSTPSVTDLATADRYGAPNLAGDPEGATSDPFSTPETLDLAAAQGYGTLSLGDADPSDVDAPAERDATLAPDAMQLGGSPMDLYRLPALPVGTEVTIVMTSDAFDTYLYLIDPDAGAYLAENDDAPDTSRSEIRYLSDGTTRPWVGASTWGSFGEGPYRIEIAAMEPEATEAAPAPEDDAPAEVATPTDLDAPGEIEATLAPDALRIDGSPMDLYRLPLLPEGAEATVELTSDAFDTYLYLIDPDAGAYLAENDDAPDTSRSEIRYLSDGTTRPWVGASTWGSFGEGPYRIAVDVTGAEIEGDAAEADEAEDAAAEAQEEAEDRPATFAEILPAFDLLPDGVALVASRIGDYVRVVSVDGDVVRSEGRQAIDW